jgi:hypothetical protein
MQHTPPDTSLPTQALRIGMQSATHTSTTARPAPHDPIDRNEHSDPHDLVPRWFSRQAFEHTHHVPR